MISSKEYNKDYYLKNKEKIDARHKEYALSNKEAATIRRKAWALLNKDKLKKQKQEEYQQLTPRERKDRDLRCKYGITVGEYEKMLQQQQQRCACCDIHETELLEKYPTSFHAFLAVDHCHKSLKVRALLCNSCNLFIGLLESRKELLPKALNYIAEHE